MKTILKAYLVSLVSLYLVSQTISGMVFRNGLETILITAAALAISALLIKPVINILLIPINLMTFGLFRFLSSAITFYLITMVVKDFNIIEFNFAGISTHYFSLPPLILHGLLAFVAFSFTISFINSILHWVVK
jgi:putative membrane protein